MILQQWLQDMCYTVLQPLSCNFAGGTPVVKNMSNHKQAMPVVQDDTLLYQKDGQAYQLSVGTPAWYAWLSSATCAGYLGYPFEESRDYVR